MFAGQLDKQVTFRRRVVVDARTRGAFEDHATVWGAYRRLSGMQAMEAGRETNVEEGTLRIRYPGPGDDVTVSDRVTIEGRDLGITSVGTPDRRGGFVELIVRSDVKS